MWVYVRDRSGETVGCRENPKRSRDWDPRVQSRFCRALSVWGVNSLPTPCTLVCKMTARTRAHFFKSPPFPRAFHVSLQPHEDMPGGERPPLRPEPSLSPEKQRWGHTPSSGLMATSFPTAAHGARTRPHVPQMLLAISSGKPQSLVSPRLNSARALALRPHKYSEVCFQICLAGD